MRPPPLPFGRRLPWVGGALGLIAAAYGAVAGDRALLLLGVFIAVAVIVAFPLASAIMGAPHDDEAAPPAGDRDQ